MYLVNMKEGRLYFITNDSLFQVLYIDTSLLLGMMPSAGSIVITFVENNSMIMSDTEWCELAYFKEIQIKFELATALR